MMVREETAKTKWCPHARLPATDGGAYNRMRVSGENMSPPSSTCIGAGCMAWRWGSLEPHKISHTPVEGWEHCPADEAGEWQEYWLEPQEEAAKRRLGWCGLSGRVEYA